VGSVGLSEVAIDDGFGDREIMAVEITKEFFVEAGGIKCLGQLGMNFRVVFENVDGLGVFIAEEEFDGAKLVGLEAGCIAEDATELDIFGGRERFEH